MKVSFLANPPILPFAAALLSLPGTLLAGPTSTPPSSSEAAPDKSQYHLFNPVPKDQMRELTTDRPDQTESAITVDAGHVQVEMDFFNYTYDRHSTDGVKTETWNIAPINVRIGLLNHLDLHVILDNYVDTRTKEGRDTIRASGFGDITLRMKYNFWGNEGGPTSFGIIPFVKLPLSASNIRNGRTEGGVILPFSVELPWGWSAGMMTEADFVSDDHGGYETEWVNSISFSRDLTKNLGMYLEFFSVVGTAPGFQWQGQVDAGLTYAISDNIQLDCGCNFGVTKSAPDFQPFAGISIRF